MESSEECWSAEQLRAAEAQIEEQKKAWEMKRLAALSGNDDERGGVGQQQLLVNDSGRIEPDVGLLTYSHRDASNQVKRKSAKVGRPPRSTTKMSNLNHSALNESVDSQRVGGGEAGGGGRRVRSKTEPNGTSITPEKRRYRKRNRGSVEGEPPPPSSVSDDSFSSSVGHLPDSDSSHPKSLSPRTRSRGTVNINLWTLDVKPLLPGIGAGSGTSPSGTMAAADGLVGNGGGESDENHQNHSIPVTKKLKRRDIPAVTAAGVVAGNSNSDDLEVDPDLDVVS